MDPYNCREAIGLLPWLLNGSLGVEERANLEAHLAVCPGCRVEAAAVTETAVLLDAHLPAEVLLRLAAAEEELGLPREAVDRHLSRCSECREDLELITGGTGEGTVVPFRPRRQIMPRKVARVAAAVAAAGVVGFFIGRSDFGSEGLEATARIGVTTETLRAGSASAGAEPMFADGFEDGTLSRWDDPGAVDSQGTVADGRSSS